jgi:hypothetical protein
MSKILLTAENFAFGPIGKLLTIADLLKKAGHKLVFAGYGTSLQLARSYPIDEIHEVDTDDPNSKGKLLELTNKTDVLISAMDLQSVLVAKSLGKPVVYVDCLFWFWEDISEGLFDIELYVGERSIIDNKNNENEEKYKLKIKNLLMVPPIVPVIKKSPRKKQALISYGGGEATHWYQVGRDTNYPSTMTNILQKHVDWTGFDRVIVTTGENILRDLATKFKNSTLEFTTCGSHAGFLEEMSQSEIVLTTCGLVTTQETFQSETPLIYLPASNNSHYILLDELREQIANLPSVHLADFMDRLSLRGLSEDVSIPEVMGQLREVENSSILQEKIGVEINKLVQTRENWSNTSVKQNKEFLESLGINGAKIVGDKVDKLLKSL